MDVHLPTTNGRYLILTRLTLGMVVPIFSS